MSVKFAAKQVVLDELRMKEHSLSIEGVIEMMSYTNEKKFFDGLFDAIIAYVEQHHAFAGLTMSHKEYK